MGPDDLRAGYIKNNLTPNSGVKNNVKILFVPSNLGASPKRLIIIERQQNLL